MSIESVDCQRGVSGVKIDISVQTFFLFLRCSRLSLHASSDKSDKETRFFLLCFPRKKTSCVLAFMEEGQSSSLLIVARLGVSLSFSRSLPVVVFLPRVGDQSPDLDRGSPYSPFPFSFFLFLVLRRVVVSLLGCVPSVVNALLPDPTKMSEQTARE